MELEGIKQVNELLTRVKSSHEKVDNNDEEALKMLYKEKKKVTDNAEPILARMTSMIGVTYKPIDKFAPFECRSLNENKIIILSLPSNYNYNYNHHLSYDYNFVRKNES